MLAILYMYICSKMELQLYVEVVCTHIGVLKEGSSFTVSIPVYNNFVLLL